MPSSSLELSPMSRAGTCGEESDTTRAAYLRLGGGQEGAGETDMSASPISRMGTWYGITSEGRPQAWQFSRESSGPG